MLPLLQITTAINRPLTIYTVGPSYVFVARELGEKCSLSVGGIGYYKVDPRYQSVIIASSAVASATLELLLLRGNLYISRESL